MLLDVTVLTPKEVVLQVRACSVVLPGEAGVFEILPFHKRIISRLISGTVFIDEKNISILRGIVKASQNKITIVMEKR